MARPAESAANGARPVPEPYVLEAQIGFLLRKAQQRATEHFNAVMEEFGVTPTQFAALAKLHELGPTSQNLLGRLTAMDPATIFSVVGRLVRRGWVAQVADPHDARLVNVSLTTDGELAARKMIHLAPNVSHKTLAPLTASEAKLLLGLIGKLG
ncbi:MAG: MarR family winged helix-turn-helix transcriptional regulator [Hyphomicrobiales bacterium]|nr:MarR family winged helix-turn-helix transcriptional regulator [Hyphomicrobiales bacterium]